MGEVFTRISTWISCPIIQVATYTTKPQAGIKTPSIWLESRSVMSFTRENLKAYAKKLILANTEDAQESLVARSIEGLSPAADLSRDGDKPSIDLPNTNHHINDTSLVVIMMQTDLLGTRLLLHRRGQV
jgi:hypothetical protein